MALRAVIFDIGGVLIAYDFDRLARELSARSGQEPARLRPLFEREVVHDVEGLAAVAAVSNLEPGIARRTIDALQRPCHGAGSSRAPTSLSE